MKTKQYFKFELYDVTPEDIDGYCNIENENYKVWQEDDKINIVFKFGDKYGDLSFILNCDELIINNKRVYNIKEFCIAFMLENGYNYDEDEGFIE